MTIKIPPGWYVDPDNSSQFRYWNGEKWTESIAKDLEIDQKQDRQSSSKDYEEKVVDVGNNKNGKKPIELKLVDNNKLIFEIDSRELADTSRYFLNSNLDHLNKNIDFIFQNEYFDYTLQKFLYYVVKFKQASDSIYEISIKVEKNTAIDNYSVVCDNLFFKLTHSPNAINKDLDFERVKHFRFGKWFDSPIYKDWIGISWLALTVLAWLPAAYRVVDSGGPFFTAPDIISGLIDGAVYPLSLFILFVIPVLVIRKIYWKYSGKEVLTDTDFSLVVVFILLIAALVGFLFYQNRQAEIALAKSKLTSVCVESEVDSFGCADYPNVYFSVCLPYDRAEAYVVLEDSYPDLSFNKSYANDCPIDRPNHFSFSGSGVMDVLGGDYRVTVNNFSSKDEAEYGNYFSIPSELREIYRANIVVK